MKIEMPLAGEKVCDYLISEYNNFGSIIGGISDIEYLITTSQGKEVYPIVGYWESLTDLGKVMVLEKYINYCKTDILSRL